MPARCEQERDPRQRQGGDHLFGGGLEIEAERFEHIGGADATTGAAIAVLGDVGSTGGSGESHGGGDVETVNTGATRTAGVDQMQGGPWGRQGAMLPQHQGHGGKLLAIQSLATQGRQQGTGEHRLDLPADPAPHQLVSLLTVQITALDQLLQQPGEGVGGTHGSSTGSGDAMSSAPASDPRLSWLATAGRWRCGSAIAKKKPGCSARGLGDGDRSTITRTGPIWRLRPAGSDPVRLRSATDA